MEPEVYFEKGLLSGRHLEKACTSFDARFAIITDSNVKDLYGDALLKQLRRWKISAELFTFPAGEIHKTRETKQFLEDQMLSKDFGRDSVIIGLGGGVVTDLAGFVASTYCRGVPLFLIPTTLLGIVDACMGGKNGVNTASGKNMIGSFLKPRHTFIDFNCLETLSKPELMNGFVEMIKHSLIAHPEHFKLFEKVKGLDTGTIVESFMIKAGIVEDDFREDGKRRLLNFGHTVGHAIEAHSNYKIPHGAAVAAGMIAEARISFSLGYLPQDAFKRIADLLIKSTKPSQATPLELMGLMAADKKSLKGTPRFVLLQDIGVPMEFDGEYCAHVDTDILYNSLQWTLDVLCSHNRAVACSH